MATTADDAEVPAEEDAAAEQLCHRAAERRHVDALLDISEEDFLKELQPRRYRCSSSWEEAVQGWARDAPLSCILLSQKKHGKLTHKDTDTPLASAAEHSCGSGPGSATSLKESASLNEQMGSWCNTAVAALQSDASEWAVLRAMQGTTSHLSFEEKIKEEPMLRETQVKPHHISSKYSGLEDRPIKPQKHIRRSCNSVVPIKNFTFLPPINPSHLNSRVAVQLRGESSAASLTTKLQTYQHNFDFAVSIPKRYQVPMSSKFDTTHRTRYSPALNSTTAAAAAAQGHMHPSYLFS